LFSGSGSVGEVAKELGYTVISLDRDMEAEIQIDIMDWDCHDFPKGFFDVIWASPPCTEYSRCKTRAPRDIESANQIVERTLDILEYFEPKYWIIENPQTGLLKDQLCMWGLPFKDIDYCKYGMPYRKRTRIWNNVFRWESKPLCKRDCNFMNETRTRHIEEAHRSGSISKRKATQNRFQQKQLNRVPSELIKEILINI
jgi:site-specific DNA-cytosine methylase